MQTFLSAFKQRFRSDELLDILNNHSNWVKFIPHEDSGVCFTYNPQRESNSGYWYSMRIVPNINGPNANSKRRRNLLNDMRIYLHEPNKFFFFKEEDAPNNIGLDLKWMQLMNRTRIVGK